jgi:hypothetical protein
MSLVELRNKEGGTTLQIGEDEKFSFSCRELELLE